MSVFTSTSWGDFELDSSTGMLVLPEGMEVETAIKYHMVVFADLYAYLPRVRTKWGKKLMPELPQRFRTKRTKVGHSVVSLHDSDTAKIAVLDAVAKALASYKEDTLRAKEKVAAAADAKHLLGVFKNNAKLA